MKISSRIALASMGTLLAVSGTVGTSWAASPAPSGPSAANQTKIAAFQACLKKQGVAFPGRPNGFGPPNGMGQAGRPTDIPSPRPSGMPSGKPNGAMPGMSASDQAKFDKAIKACGGFPGGGFGGSGGAPGKQMGTTALKAYEGCMKDNGVTVQPGKPFAASDAKAVAANKKCSVLLPKR